MPTAPDSASAHAAGHAAATLASALLESAWITSRITAGLGLATFAIGVLTALRPVARREDAAAAAPGAGRRRDSLVHALALVLGGAAVALTRGEAQRVLPGALQALVAALAAVLGAGGGWLGAWSVRTLARADRGALVTTGPYGIVRHPLYLALAACVTAVGLAIGSLTGTLALAAMLAVVSAWRARREERRLAREHADAWSAYAARVRAFTPRI